MNIEPIKYLIVDDEELDRWMISAFAKQYKSLKSCGDFENSLEALGAINSIQPDLVFLDIEMPEVSGLELLKAVREIVPMAVFITSYSEFAVDGFGLSALDYILKPLTEERFAQCMKRVEEYWEMKQKSNAYDVFVEQDTLTIKQGHDKLKLQMNDIIYLEAMNDYTKLYTSGKSYITIGALSNFMELLPKDHFHRIHRSYAVARNKITGLKKNEVLCGTLALPIGKTYKNSLTGIMQ